jgi:putative phage-type endonuclease
VTTVVVPAGAEREQWLAARRAGIGASEIAAVLGISPWESPFSLYWRKVNGWDYEPSDEMSAGTRLEPVIADWWADTFDPLENLDILEAGLLAHDERPWQLATPDRVLCSSDDPWGAGGALAVLECKYVAHSWDGWGEPDSDDIPVYYRSQVLWQCDVLDVRDWYLAALGPGGFRGYRGHTDERDLVLMREAGRRFMARLEADDPPPVDEHSATLTALRRLHPDLDDDEVEVDPAVAAGYRRACRMAKLAQAAKKRYEARLREQMCRARRATSGGSFVASRSVFEVAEHPVKAHTVDRLNPPRERKA